MPPAPPAPPTPPSPPQPPGPTPINLAFGVTDILTGPSSNNLTISGVGSNTIGAGDGVTLVVSGGGNTVSLHDRAAAVISGGANNIALHDKGSLTVYGGGNTIALHDNDILTINDARSVASGYSGTIKFGDSISGHNSDTISLNYSLTLGSGANVDIGANAAITGLDKASAVTTSLVVNAGQGDTLTFIGFNEQVVLNAASGDVVRTTGAGNTITVGGTASLKSSLTIGATASGTTIDGGLGTDTFTGGAGYDGGNHYVGSYHGYQDGFNAIGTCVNYANMACRVAVNLNTNIGQAFDASGNALSPDTYTNIQQIKAGQLDGNDLTGSDSYYTEIKGGVGSVTYHGGAAGDRIIWSSAGATGLLDGQGTDIAYGGSGADEFYWRNSPGGKGVSNFGETIYGFNAAQGDNLNLSEFADAGFAGVSKAFTFSDISSWVSVGIAGNDSVLYFDKSGSGNFSNPAVTLKNDNLFADFGVTDQGSAGAQQLVQNLYNTGHLVLTQPH